MKTVTLSTLVADTGEPVRTIQYWSDLGVLRAERSTDRQGRGNRRVYQAEPLFGERKYALLASAMNKLRIPVGDIRSFIDADRLFWHRIASVPPGGGLLLQPGDPPAVGGHPYYEEALAGAQGIYMLIVPSDSGPHPFHVGYLRIGVSGFNKEFAKGNDMVIAGIASRAPSSILLNLSKIFAPLFPELHQKMAEDAEKTVAEFLHSLEVAPRAKENRQRKR
jgi:hypothetical protein